MAGRCGQNSVSVKKLQLGVVVQYTLICFIFRHLNRYQYIKRVISISSLYFNIIDYKTKINVDSDIIIRSFYTGNHPIKS